MAQSNSKKKAIESVSKAKKVTENERYKASSNPDSEAVLKAGKSKSVINSTGDSYSVTSRRRVAQEAYVDDDIEVNEEQADSSEDIVEEVVGETPQIDERAAQRMEDNEANKEGLKVAARAIATYYGGAKGNAIVGTINDSGVADPIYNRAARITTGASKVLPGGSTAQTLANSFNRSGTFDAANQAVDAMASSKGSGAASNAGKTAASEAGKTAAKEGAKDTAKTAAKNTSSQSASNASSKKKGIKSLLNSKPDVTFEELLYSLFKDGAKLIFFACPFLVIFLIIILLIILGGAGGDNESYMDSLYDMSLTMVTVTNDYTNESDAVRLERISLMEFIEGAAYAEFRNSLNDKSNSEKLEIYKTFMVAGKSIVLSLGHYVASTKEVDIKSGASGMPYCDVNVGCKIINNNGVYSYITANNHKEVPGTIVGTIEPLSESEKDLLRQAYNETYKYFLVPKDVNSIIMEYNFARPPYNQTIKNKWITNSSKKYTDIIKATEEYKDFKIYNMEDYITEYTYASSNSYWWPIGSTNPTNGKIYGGTPSTTYISSKYGPRTIQGQSGFHSGIDIADSGCSKNVIIATRAGTVTTALGGCTSTGSYGNTCNGGAGNYVEIDHGDGTSSIYMHMAKDSIVVKQGQTVIQGEKIGLMGSSGSSTGCHLHFGIKVNGSYTDPLNYISASNPRPVSNVDTSYQSGSSNKQSVCLSLKTSGFSNNAVAAIMTNMQAESSFRTDALGDGGTSYGLCQWHNGRYSALKNYCGSEYNTVKCQLAYLIKELRESYKGVYNNLLSNNTANAMASYYCIHFEVPANRYENCPNRANRYSSSMLSYVTAGCK